MVKDSNTQKENTGRTFGADPRDGYILLNRKQFAALVGGLSYGEGILFAKGSEKENPPRRRSDAYLLRRDPDADSMFGTLNLMKRGSVALSCYDREFVMEALKTLLPDGDSFYVSIDCVPEPLRIGGLQKTTLLDYPGQIASTIFLSGCNLRCVFCHNRGLAEATLQPDADSATTMTDQEEILDLLINRKDRVNFVCISGGEPLPSIQFPGKVHQAAEKRRIQGQA